MELAGRINKIAIKSYDTLDYLYNRSTMHFCYTMNLVRKILYLHNIKHILIVRLASIGDVVRSTSVIEGLRKKYPNAKIDFLTSCISLPVIQDNPIINRIFTLKDINILKKNNYDWIINLQRPDPPQAFLKDSDLNYKELLLFLSEEIGYKMQTGRCISKGRDISHTDLFYCQTEIEELFMMSLLPYTHDNVTDPKIYLADNSQAILDKFGLQVGKNYLGIFLGSNSAGGEDEGWRTYSIGFIEELVKVFVREFTIVIIGQSNVKTPEEIELYNCFVKKYPNVVNLVDKTNLGELLYIIQNFKLLISCDSSPFHMAIALKTPVIGLYVHTAEFRVSPKMHGEKYVLINSFNPCFKYNWRWKFHCLSCKEKHSEMYGCYIKNIPNKIDLISMQAIKNAAQRLLNV